MPRRPNGWQLPSDMVEAEEEEEEEEEEISDPTPDLIEGVGETERLEAAEMKRELLGSLEDDDFRLLLLLLLPMRFSVRLVLLVGHGPEEEALSTRKKTTRQSAETKQ